MMKLCLKSTLNEIRFQILDIQGETDSKISY